MENCVRDNAATLR